MITPYTILSKLKTRIKEAIVSAKAHRLNTTLSAKIEPFRLIYIDPNEVENRLRDRFINKYSAPQVVGGDWELEPYNEGELHKSFEAHFIQGVEWEDTIKYQNMVKRVTNGRSWHGCSSERELKNRFRRIDRLYRKMAEEGYKGQKEIQNDPMESNTYSPLNEVVVDIDRDGEFVFDQGYHRMSLARIIGFDEIPVRVLVRHRKWQQLRDTVYEGRTDEVDEDILTHPDIEYLTDGQS